MEREKKKAQKDKPSFFEKVNEDMTESITYGEAQRGKKPKAQVI